MRVIDYVIAHKLSHLRYVDNQKLLELSLLHEFSYNKLFKVSSNWNIKLVCIKLKAHFLSLHHFL
jgi:hypothetical protein